MDANEQIVRQFCADWAKPDFDQLAGYFTDDAVYHNMPFKPINGKAKIREVFGTMAGLTNADWEMLNVAVNGDVVFTERVDRFKMGEKDVAIPVCGVFELRDGKIAAWRDYFDLATWQKQTEG